MGDFVVVKVERVEVTTLRFHETDPSNGDKRTTDAPSNPKITIVFPSKKIP